MAAEVGGRAAGLAFDEGGEGFAMFEFSVARSAFDLITTAEAGEGDFEALGVAPGHTVADKVALGGVARKP